MASHRSGDETPASDRWDRVLKRLAARPRRQVIISLLDATPDRHLPLPDAAIGDSESTDPEAVTIQLRHCHLPVLADPGYVEWDDDPFRVRRGPNFTEVRAVVEILLDAADRLPPELVDGCPALEEALTD